MKPTPKKKAAKKTAPPTRKELTEQLENLRRKVWLQQLAWRGEAARLELLNLCGVKGSDSPEKRQLQANVLFNCSGIDLGYVLQGES